MDSIVIALSDKKKYNLFNQKLLKKLKKKFKVFNDSNIQIKLFILNKDNKKLLTDYEIYSAPTLLYEEASIKHNNEEDILDFISNLNLKCKQVNLEKDEFKNKGGGGSKAPNLNIVYPKPNTDHFDDGDDDLVDKYKKQLGNIKDDDDKELFMDEMNIDDESMQRSLGDEMNKRRTKNPNYPVKSSNPSKTQKYNPMDSEKELTIKMYMNDENILSNKNPLD